MTTPPTETSPIKGERLNKYLARCGVASRRGAEELIVAGKVAINGHVVRELGTLVAASDAVTLKGKPLTPAAQVRMWRYHKPEGQMTTHYDPQERLTVFDAIHGQDPTLPRLISVGRLDFTTEGLLLLTNLGSVAHHLEQPANGWTRRYRVRAHGRPPKNFIDLAAQGLTIEDIHYESIHITEDSRQGSNLWYTVSLTEGKNREIRRVFEAFDLQVNRLIRVAYGPFQLGNLARGTCEEVPPRILKDQLGAAYVGSTQTS